MSVLQNKTSVLAQIPVKLFAHFQQSCGQTHSWQANLLKKYSIKGLLAITFQFFPTQLFFIESVKNFEYQMLLFSFAGQSWHKVLSSSCSQAFGMVAIQKNPRKTKSYARQAPDQKLCYQMKISLFSMRFNTVCTI